MDDATALTQGAGLQPTEASISLKKKSRPAEIAIEAFLFIAAVISILTTIAIVFILLEEAVRFFADPNVTLQNFLTGTKWQPQAYLFGIWPLLSATLMVTVIAMLVAIPLGLMSAIYLSEYASERVRGFLKPALELLAGIRTVV
jgi:phosphate transport system permease protein